MRYGAHLPLVDFSGAGWRAGDLAAFADTARQLYYRALGANDHFVFQRPWLDPLIALASVVQSSGDLQLATTIALPVVRGPVALAKAAAALDILSGGRLVLGVGPGSSDRDYHCVGVDFSERWARLDEAVRMLRAQLRGGGPVGAGRFYPAVPALEPRPDRPAGPPLWIGSWGSAAGLRRVARLGDGWLASAYNTTPEQFAEGRARLARALAANGRHADGFPCALATMWTFVTGDRAVAREQLAALARMLDRPIEELAERVLIGAPEQCAARLRAWQRAGVDLIFVWPLADPHDQLERLMRDVVPLV